MALEAENALLRRELQDRQNFIIAAAPLANKPQSPTLLNKPQSATLLNTMPTLQLSGYLDRRDMIGLAQCQHGFLNDLHLLLAKIRCQNMALAVERGRMQAEDFRQGGGPSLDCFWRERYGPPPGYCAYNARSDRMRLERIASETSAEHNSVLQLLARITRYWSTFPQYNATIESFLQSAVQVFRDRRYSSEQLEDLAQDGLGHLDDMLETSEDSEGSEEDEP